VVAAFGGFDDENGEESVDGALVLAENKALPSPFMSPKLDTTSFFSVNGSAAAVFDSALAGSRFFEAILSVAILSLWVENGLGATDDKGG
jgi:hypothetical protein